jgi:hypothetical protein
MRNVLVFFCPLFITFLSCAPKKELSLKLTYTSNYCGGARPTEEMENGASKPRAYADRSVIIISEKGKIDSVRTNSEGVLKKKLRAGSYKLFEPWRYNLFTPENLPIDAFDRECLKNEWQKQMFQVTISKEEVKTISVTPIIFFCPWAAPCLLQQEVPPGR